MDPMDPMTAPTPRPRHRRPLARSPLTRLPLLPVAVALVALAVLAALAGTVPGANAAPPTTGWVRAAHLAPDAPKAKVLLTPFSGGETRTLRGVAYSDVTPYARVPVGLYTVDVRAAGAADGEPPMVSKTVRVTEDAAITVVASGEEGDVSAQAVYDDLRAPEDGKAKIRLVSAVPNTAVTAAVEGGPVLAREVTTGSATGYAQVDAQEWTVDLRASGSRTRARVAVESGGVYTLLALRGAGGGLSLQAVEDTSGSQVTPRGGVDTGGGGLAPSSAGEALPVDSTWSYGIAEVLLPSVVPDLRRGTR